MPREKLKQTLQALHEELAAESQIDPELQQLLATLDHDIHHLLDEETPDEDPGGVMDAAESLAARFAIEYPRTEAVFRELINSLAKMGI